MMSDTQMNKNIKTFKSSRFIGLIVRIGRMRISVSVVHQNAIDNRCSSSESFNRILFLLLYLSSVGSYMYQTAICVVFFFDSGRRVELRNQKNGTNNSY